MSRIDDGVYALFDDGELCCVASGEIAWLTLPGAARRNLPSGFYDLDMRFLGSVVEDLVMHDKEIKDNA